MNQKSLCFNLLITGGLVYLASGCAVMKYAIKTQPDIPYRKEDYRHPETIVGSHAVVYRPAVQVSQETDADDMQLLYSQAPIIVQGAADRQNYDPTSDKIGSPTLYAADDEEFNVVVDTDQPVLYARIESETIYGREVKQLVYNYWYPRHPVGIFEKGNLDGGVLRVTLDSNDIPSVYEHVWPCGCFHNLFVADHIEENASAEFLEILPEKDRFTETSVKKHLDWNVQDLIDGAGERYRPVLFISAGSHRCLALQTEKTVRNLEQFPSTQYALAEYETLTRLPVENKPGRTASMFNPRMLVWGGKRVGEEILFYGMMHHAGWPRHLDVMRIHWDEEAWTQPDLLMTFLRLPHRMIENARITEEQRHVDASQ